MKLHSGAQVIFFALLVVKVAVSTYNGSGNRKTADELERIPDDIMDDKVKYILRKASVDTFEELYELSMMFATELMFFFEWRHIHIRWGRLVDIITAIKRTSGKYSSERQVAA